MANNKQSKRSPREGYKRFEVELPEKVVNDFNANVAKREGSAYYRTRVLRRLLDKYNAGMVV